MEINIDAQKLCATVGLEAGEADDPEVWRSLQPIIDEYKRKDYLLIIREVKTN